MTTAAEQSDKEPGGLLATLLGRGRSKPDPLLELLSQVSVFSDLNRKELRKLKGIMHQREYQRGEYMFEAGQPGAAMFVITEGRLSITIDGPDDTEVEVASLGKGDFVGELALLDDSSRSASAKAVEDTRALAFFRTDLNALLQTEPVLGSKIFRKLALLIGTRLKAMNAQAQEREAEISQKNRPAPGPGPFHE